MWSSIWSVATTRTGFWTWIWSTRHGALGQEVACWYFNAGKIQLFLLDWSKSIGAVDVKGDSSVLEDYSFWLLGLLANCKSVVNKVKSAIPPLFNSPEVLSSAFDKGKLLPENCLFICFFLLELIWNCIIFL